MSALTAETASAAAAPAGSARRRRPWRALVAALVLAALAVATSREIHALRRTGRAGGELMYFPSGYLLKPMALGHPLTFADFLWLRAIQYYGEHRMTDNQFPMAGHVFSTITQLDPRFVEAYLFGGLVLAAEGRDRDRGLALMKDGVAWNPERWELPFWTGFVYYLMREHEPDAAYYFARAARLPGAPGYVVRFAAHAKAESGDLATALALWQDLLENSTNPAMQTLAAQKMAEIEAELARSGARPARKER
jgi:tetratricopeptide (TPR) repeat protein